MRVIGLEPTRLAAPDPKSGAAANYATPAGASVYSAAKVSNIFCSYNYLGRLLLGSLHFLASFIRNGGLFFIPFGVHQVIVRYLLV